MSDVGTRRIAKENDVQPGWCSALSTFFRGSCYTYSFPVLPHSSGRSSYIAVRVCPCSLYFAEVNARATRPRHYHGIPCVPFCFPLFAVQFCTWRRCSCRQIILLEYACIRIDSGPRLAILFMTLLVWTVVPRFLLPSPRPDVLRVLLQLPISLSSLRLVSSVHPSAANVVKKLCSLSGILCS